MTWLEAVLLGVIQGLAEFLPVSSSGHLVIAQKILGFSAPPVFFDVLVHVGTLMAVIVYFRDRWLKLTGGQIKLLVLATVPAVVVGVLLNPVLGDLFNSLWVVMIGLVITGTLLVMSSGRFSDSGFSIDKMSGKQALLIGLFQALAIMPGVSRSGSTVVGGVMMGLKKQAAFFFSFFMAVPAILGALVLQLVDNQAFGAVDSMSLVIGFGVALVTGLFSLKILEKVINSSKLNLFAYYCFGLAIVLLVVSL